MMDNQEGIFSYCLKRLPNKKIRIDVERYKEKRKLMKERK